LLVSSFDAANNTVTCDTWGTPMKKASRLQGDVLIAVAALLISTVAALASVYQSRLIASQLSATIWPYLSVQTRYPGNGRMTVVLVNDGVGPALIRSARATFDGKLVTSWNEVLSQFIGDAKRASVHHAGFSATGIDQASIVRPGDQIQLLSLTATRGQRVVLAERKRLRLQFCYCSILNRCWSMDSEAQGRLPQDTASCPENESINAAPLNE